MKPKDRYSSPQPPTSPEHLTPRELYEALFHSLSATCPHLSMPLYSHGEGPYLMFLQRSQPPLHLVSFEIQSQAAFLANPAKPSTALEDDGFIKKVFESFRVRLGKKGTEEYDLTMWKAVPDTPECEVAVIELNKTNPLLARCVALIAQGRRPRFAMEFLTEPMLAN